MIYFISDLHFDDSHIIDYENRPFDNVNIMNQTIIQNWNDIVMPEDEVYVLGDVGNEEFIQRLNGTKYLVKGNHDVKCNEVYRQCGFAEVYDHPIILADFWILSHQPLYVNENMPYANLFGHVHNSPLYKTFSRQHYCVTAERIGYKPIAFAQVQQAVQG